MTNNTTAARTVAACRQAGADKYHAAVLRDGQPVATKCNYSTIANDGSRRILYPTGTFVNCKKCQQVLAKEAREQR